MIRLTKRLVETTRPATSDVFLWDANVAGFGCRIYRRELHTALCSALRSVLTGTHDTLADAVWDVQNRRRHSGRRLGQRNIGSTLLVKGLQFDHAIIVDVEKLKRNDLYVAITRGARSLTIISHSNVLRPKP
jgi:DNA helicase-2/ATP-dependent DNA helicase PcrA